MAKKKTVLHPLYCSGDQPGPACPFITALSNKSDLFRKLVRTDTTSASPACEVSTTCSQLGAAARGLWHGGGRVAVFLRDELILYPRE